MLRWVILLICVAVISRLVPGTKPVTVLSRWCGGWVELGCEKAEAVRRISFVRLSSAFSLFRRRFFCCHIGGGAGSVVSIDFGLFVPFLQSFRPDAEVFSNVSACSVGACLGDVFEMVGQLS